MSVHQAIAVGIVEALNQALDFEWLANTVKPSSADSKWCVVVIPRLSRAWPQVNITLTANSVEWRGFWSEPEWYTTQVTPGDIYAVPAQRSKASDIQSFQYDDYLLVSKIMKLTSTWMEKYANCTMCGQPSNTRPATKREWYKGWREDSIGSAFFDSPDEIPSILLHRDMMPSIMERTG